MDDPVHPDQPYTLSTETREQGMSRRLKMKSTIEDVLTEVLTQSFGPSLKAAQITLALEAQINDIIAAAIRRTGAVSETAPSVVSEVAATVIPDTLCAVEGCVLIAPHEGRKHSWERQ